MILQDALLRLKTLINYYPNLKNLIVRYLVLQNITLKVIINLKKNIKLISKSNSGLNVYSFEYINKKFVYEIKSYLLQDSLFTMQTEFSPFVNKILSKVRDVGKIGRATCRKRI